MQLLRTPQAHPDEGYPGYLLRLADANVLPGIESMFNALRHEASVIEVAATPPAELEKLLGVSCPVQPKQARTARPDVGSSERLEGRLLMHYGWTSEPAWCPKCLVAKPYWRSIWDSPLVPACTLHGARLMRHCPTCKSAVSYRRPQLLYCQCGSNLSSAPTELASAEELWFQRCLLGMDEFVSYLPKQLLSLPLQDQRNALRFIANRLLKLKTGTYGNEHVNIADLASTEGGQAFLRAPDDVVSVAIRRIATSPSEGPILAMLAKSECLPPFIRDRAIGYREMGSTRARECLVHDDFGY